MMKFISKAGNILFLKNDLIFISNKVTLLCLVSSGAGD